MKSISFSSWLNLTASGKQRRFQINAYSGGLLVVGGFEHPVVVDLSGLDTTNSIPILIDHRSDVESTLGLTDRIENNGRSLTLGGPITGQSALANQVLAQSAAGHIWQASIGASVVESENIAAGVSVNLNGQKFTGPVIVARRSILKETSVLPMGADSSTSVNLAAKAVALKGSLHMTFSEWLVSLGIAEGSLTSEGTAILQKMYENAQALPADGETPAVPVASAAGILNLRASHAADHERIAHINSLAFGHPSIAATAIRSGWSPEKTEIAVLKASSGTFTPSNRMRGGGGPDETQVVCASLALSAGGSTAFMAKHYGENVIDAASRIEARGATLRTICDHVLKAAGMSSPSNRMTDQYVRAAFEASRKLEASGLSTMSLPGILSNSANKLMLEGYDSIPATWKEYCVVGNLGDFKEASRYRMIAGGQFEQLGPGGQIKHLNLTTEQTYTNQAKTYASMVSLDRQSIINDDLGAFEALPKSIGRLAHMKLEKTVYTLLLLNTGNVFHANNSNKLTGANSALDIGAVSDAEAAFLRRTDDNGDPVMLTPQLMLVPPTLSVTANQLVRDTQVVAVGVGASAAVTPFGNPHAGRFTAVCSPWLENANLSGYSATGWYLIARPQGSSGLIEVGFLNGQQTPTIESGDLDFSQLGISLRGFWDFGVAFQDSRYGVWNTGV